MVEANKNGKLMGVQVDDRAPVIGPGRETPGLAKCGRVEHAEAERQLKKRGRDSDLGGETPPGARSTVEAHDVLLGNLARRACLADQAGPGFEAVDVQKWAALGQSWWASS